MIALAAAVLGAMTALGAMAIAAGLLPRSGWRPARVPPGRPRHSYTGRALLLAAMVLAGCFCAGWLLTGWPIGGATACSALLVARRAADSSARRKRWVALSEAIAGWSEILADMMRSHSGLGQAVADTAPFTASVLRPYVNDLVADMQKGSLDAALDRFGDQVQHPTADLVIGALQLAHRGGSRNLATSLQTIADQTRARVEMTEQVQAGRNRLFAEAKAMVAVTLGMTALALLFGRAYMAPYDSLPGQIALSVVGAMYSGAGLALVELGRPASPPSPLSGGRPHRGFGP